MKKTIAVLVFLPMSLMAQVGINTVAPKAALDVESTNNGMLIPRVLLTSVLDISTVINPNAGPLETSTLVYNMASAGIAPNNVVAGFYYWNGSRWMAIAGNTTSDHDWYEEGTTTPPDALTDNMFHTGNVAIGKNTADYPLEVNTTDFQIGINNVLTNPMVTGTQKTALRNTITDDTNDIKYAVVNTVTGNSAASGGIGVRNNISGTGRVFYGNSNYLTAGLNSDGADMIGVRNEIGTDSNNTSLRGVFSIFNGAGGNMNFIYGVDNQFRVTAIGKIGTFNNFDANTDGSNSGIVNSLNTDRVFNNQSGVVNTFNTGVLTQGDNVGLYNYFLGDGNGKKTGSFTRIDSGGNGEHTGTEQIINGSSAGTGTKYGTRTIINSLTGGTHYGVHSTVLKPGTQNFAGYFLGNVGIGTTTTNTYTFPASRGANGQIIQTDGSGNLSWQYPGTVISNTSWSVNGNTVNAATDFLGSTNDANVVFKRNNANAGFIGQYNTAFGMNTLPAVTGVYNVAVGVNALAGLGLADQNCAIGWNALSNVTIGGNNIGIGTNAQVPSPTANNQIRIGNVNIGYAGIQVAWSVTSDSRWKSDIRKTDLGLDFINSLNPVFYTRKNDPSKKTEYGFIAQELDQTLNEFGASGNGMITKDSEGMFSVRYNDLLAPMVKAIQELTVENEALKQQNEAFEKRLKALEKNFNPTLQSE